MSNINNKERIIIDNDSYQILKKAENSAMEVAKYLLSLDPSRQYFTKNIVTLGREKDLPLIEGSFRLNKILHMCQIFHCVKHKKPLFKELMMAFKHGAVVHKVYADFYELYKIIQKPAINLTSEEQDFIKKVFYYFKESDNLRLQHLSHQDPAWELGRENENDLMPLTEKLITYYAKFFDDTLVEIEGR